MNWVLLICFPVRYLLAQMVCLIIEFLCLESEFGHLTVFLFNFLIYNLIINWCLFNNASFPISNNDCAKRFWLDVGLDLVRVSHEVKLFDVSNGLISPIDSLWLLKSNLTSFQRFLHLNHLCLLLILRPDLSWDYLWHLKCKESIVNCEQKEDPMISVWSIIDAPFSSDWILLMSASDCHLHFFHGKWVVVLTLEHNSSKTSSLIKHFNNHLKFHINFILLYVADHFIKWNFIISGLIHGDEELFDDVDWDFEGGISLTKILIRPLITRSQFLHTCSFIRCLCSQCSNFNWWHLSF